jgi:acetyl esterase
MNPSEELPVADANPLAQLPGADVLAQLFAQNPPRSPLEMRKMLEGFASLMNAGAPEVGALHERVPIADGAITADIAVPRGSGPFPVLVYLHGGGWVAGSPRTHRKLGLRFADAGYLVVNVDYRMAPEHPFPTPFDDCVAAVKWAAREASRFGGDGARLAVGGDSAGGNLSAAVAAALASGPDAVRLRAALLIYGVFDFARLGEAVPGVEALPGVSPELGDQMMELMVGAYLGDETVRAAKLPDPRVSPLHAAAKLPPCHVVCGTADPLIGQARALRDALASAGVDHEYVEDAGMPHGYLQMEFLPAARPAIERMVKFLDARMRG